MVIRVLGLLYDEKKAAQNGRGCVQRWRIHNRLRNVLSRQPKCTLH